MERRAAILGAQNHEWSVEEIEIADLGPGEVLVEPAYASLMNIL